MGGQAYSNGEREVKYDVTKFIFGQAPNCHGKSLLLMTSLTFLDFDQCLEQGKIDGKSTIFNVENLQSYNKMVNPSQERKGENKQQTWLRLWKEEFYSRCDKYQLGHLKYSFHFNNDIINMSLYHLAKGNPFKFVYADTCNQPTDNFFNWINSYSTYNGIDSGGSIAFTLALYRTKPMKSPILDESRREKIALISDEFKGYKNQEEYDKYEEWVNAIIEKVEAKKMWELDRAIHYREKSDSNKEKANMVTAIFKKQE